MIKINFITVFLSWISPMHGFDLTLYKVMSEIKLVVT